MLSSLHQSKYKHTAPAQAGDEWMKAYTIKKITDHFDFPSTEVFLTYFHSFDPNSAPDQIPHTGGISQSSPSLCPVCPGLTTPRSPVARPGHEAPAPRDLAGHRRLGPRPQQEAGGHRPSPVRHQSSLHQKHSPGECCGHREDWPTLMSWSHQIAVYLEWQPAALQAEPQYRQQYWNIEGETAECSPAKETKTGEFWLPTLDVIFKSLLTRQPRDLTCCCWDKRPARS